MSETIAGYERDPVGEGFDLGNDRGAVDERVAPGGSRPTLRDRIRAEVRIEILRAARTLLTPHRTGELSLRAVAREVGIAPSALYRYFESRQDLIAAVAEDAFESVHAALTKCRAEVETALPSGEQAVVLASTLRGWCRHHPAQASLILGTQVGVGEDALFKPSHYDLLLATPLDHYVQTHEAGNLLSRSPATPGDGTTSMRRVPDGAAVARLDEPTLRHTFWWGWASLLGFVALEINGAMPWLFAGGGAAFERLSRTTLYTMGYDVRVDEANPRLPDL